MEVKKIKLKELGKKDYTVLTSVRNIQRLYKYNLAIARVLDIDESEEIKMTEQVNIQMSVLDETLAFIRAILDLDDPEYDKLQDFDMDSLNKLAQKIGAILQGMDEQEVADAPKEK